jgi:hypothetical protein
MKNPLLTAATDPETAGLPLPIPGCQFPRLALRGYRDYLTKCIRNVERDAQLHGISLNDIIDLMLPFQEQVTLIDKLQISHEQIYGCGCWYSPEERIREQRLLEQNPTMPRVTAGK